MLNTRHRSLGDILCQNDFISPYLPDCEFDRCKFFRDDGRCETILLAHYKICAPGRANYSRCRHDRQPSYVIMAGEVARARGAIYIETKFSPKLGSYLRYLSFRLRGNAGMVKCRA